jgi:hypothetical protein
MSREEVNHRSLKCALASFLANYIAGVLHPFDLIKTRFQSTPPPTQATMANLSAIWCLATAASSTPSGKSTGRRE